MLEMFFPKEDEEIELDENGNDIRYNDDGEVIVHEEKDTNLLSLISDDENLENNNEDE